MNSKQKGSHGVGMAVAYFTSVGLVVSLPINDSQNYDLVIDDGVLKKVQVKYAGRVNEVGNHVASLRSVSGTSRQTYSTFKESEVELLFIVDGTGRMLKIPREDVTAVSNLTITPDLLGKYQVKLGE